MLQERIAALGIGRRLREVSVEARWAELVGPEVAAHTRTIKIEEGRLFVTVDEPTWRQELVYQKEAIMERLNSAVGNDEAVVTDILFIGP